MVEQTNNIDEMMDGSDDEFFDACEDINQSKSYFVASYRETAVFVQIILVGCKHFTR